MFLRFRPAKKVSGMEKKDKATAHAVARTMSCEFFRDSTVYAASGKKIALPMPFGIRGWSETSHRRIVSKGERT
jgi:hypothetical protein